MTRYDSEEVNQAWQDYWKDRTNFKARNVIVMANQGIIGGIIGKFTGRYNPEIVKELLMEGEIALIDAIRKYDPGSGSFGNYATLCVGKVLSAKAPKYYRTIKRPGYVESGISRLSRIEAELQRGDEPPTVEGVVRAWNQKSIQEATRSGKKPKIIDPSGVQKLREVRQQRTSSYDKPTGVKETGWVDIIPDPDHENRLPIEELMLLKALIQELPPNQGYVIEQYYLCEKPQPEIARELGVPDQQVHKLVQKAFQALCTMAGNTSPTPFKMRQNQRKLKTAA